MPAPNGRHWDPWVQSRSLGSGGRWTSLFGSTLRADRVPVQIQTPASVCSVVESHTATPPSYEPTYPTAWLLGCSGLCGLRGFCGRPWAALMALTTTQKRRKERHKQAKALPAAVAMVTQCTARTGSAAEHTNAHRAAAMAIQATTQWAVSAMRAEEQTSLQPEPRTSSGSSGRSSVGRGPRGAQQKPPPPQPEPRSPPRQPQPVAETAP